jgi:hypothetical protein
MLHVSALSSSGCLWKGLLYLLVMLSPNPEATVK